MDISTRPHRPTPEDIIPQRRSRASFQSYHGYHVRATNHHHRRSHHSTHTPYHRRASTPITRRQPSPPPARLSIAERFMSSSSPCPTPDTDEKAEMQQRQQRLPDAANDTILSDRPRLSIAEQFMTTSRSPIAALKTTSSVDEKAQSDHRCSFDDDGRSSPPSGRPTSPLNAVECAYPNECCKHPSLTVPPPIHPYCSTTPAMLRVAPLKCAVGHEKHVPQPREDDDDTEAQVEKGRHRGGCIIRPSTSAARLSTAPMDMRRDRIRRRRRRRSICVVFFFVLLITCALGVFIGWPRAPLIRIDGASLLSAPQVTETNRQPHSSNVAFETRWLVHASVDSRANFVPIQWITETVVKDALTGLVIGRQPPDREDINTWVLAPRTMSNATLPIHIDYQARDKTDVTFKNLYTACFERQALQIQFWVTLRIPALEWMGYKPSIIALPARGGLACPVK